MKLWQMIGLVALGAIGALIIKNMMNGCSCHKKNGAVSTTVPLTNGTTTTVVTPTP